MAEMKAKIGLIDEISNRLGSIAERGKEMIQTWTNTERVASSAMAGVDRSAESLYEVLGKAGVASANAINVAEQAFAQLDKIAQSADPKDESWANGMDALTNDMLKSVDALSNAEKELTEALSDCDQIMKQGTTDVEALANATERAEQARTAFAEAQSNYFNSTVSDFEEYQTLTDNIAASEEAFQSLTASMEEANDRMLEMSQNGATAKQLEAIKEASDTANEAIGEFRVAQNEAETALENFNNVLLKSPGDLEALHAAAEKASKAIEDLYKTQQNAEKAVKEFGEAEENSGKKITDTIVAISEALATAKIYEKVTEISKAVYEMSTAFSEAESVVVTATGATGAALGGLTDSMMDAYAASKTGSLGDTAGAIGEINTRMHLTGEELTDVTEKFLDYADITGSNVVSSVQDVTKVMNKWNVEQSNVESVLDKLAYTAQASGASVSSLSSAVISGAATYQQLGLSLDNTISMLGELELAGVSASSAMTGMRQAVNNAAEDGVEANTYFLDTIESISNAATETEAAAIAADAFGKRAGQELALAIRSGTISVETFNSTLEEADGTLRKTAEAAQTLDEKWEQSTNNIQAAFTKAVEPTIDKVSSGLANATDKIGDFLNENEALTKGLVAGGTSIATFVVGITGIATAITVVIPLIKTLALSMVEALHPAGLIIAGISALAIGIGTFVALSNDSSDAMEGMTATTRAHYDELQRLNEEYERTVEEYGEASAEAIVLKGKVEEATATFEEQQRTLSDLYTSIDEVCNSHEKLAQDYYDTQQSIYSQQTNADALVNKLSELAGQSERTAGSQEQMKSIITELNRMFPELGLNVEDVTGNISELGGQIDALAGKSSLQQEKDNASETYAQLLAEREKLEIAKNEAEQEMLRAGEQYADMGIFAGTFGTLSANIFGSDNAVKRYNDAQEAYERASKDLAENDRLTKECVSTMERYDMVVTGISEDTISAADATNIAFSSVRADVKSLVEDYYNAYDAAYQSISGQMGLFEQMAISCEISTDEMIAALKSQSEYMKEYGSNLMEAANVGINEGLIAELSDGSQESAGYLDAILNKIDELGAGTEEAKAFIDELNNSFVDVAEQKDAFASTVADMETEFSERLSEINVELEDMVGTMNMEDGAAAAAGATIEAYIETIKAGAAGAEDAAALVNAAVSRGLNAEAWDYNEMSARANPTKALVPGHANGTTNAEDIFVAGENGPELIVGAQGSTVFPTDETDRIIAAIGSRPFNIMPSSTEYSAAAENAPSPESYKRISLEITGAGAITIDRSADREQILNVMTENIKPVLLDIIQKEMFEEGEGSYDF